MAAMASRTSCSVFLSALVLRPSAAACLTAVRSSSLSPGVFMVARSLLVFIKLSWVDGVSLC